jgi:hypothetical protein
MQEIILKTISGQHEGQEIKINYRDQIEAILNVPMDMRSADLNEVRRSIRVLDALSEGNAILKLEDADYEYLKQRVLAARWPFINKAILQFVDDVTMEA